MTNEITKVELPREVIEAIESMREVWEDTMIFYKSREYDIISGTHKNKNAMETIREYFRDRGDDLMRALVVGYTEEISPEEKIRLLYEMVGDPYEEYDCGARRGIIETLDYLGIKIGGINEE